VKGRKSFWAPKGEREEKETRKKEEGGSRRESRNLQEKERASFREKRGTAQKRRIPYEGRNERKTKGWRLIRRGRERGGLSVFSLQDRKNPGTGTEREERNHIGKEKRDGMGDYLLAVRKKANRALNDYARGNRGTRSASGGNRGGEKKKNRRTAYREGGKEMGSSARWPKEKGKRGLALPHRIEDKRGGPSNHRAVKYQRTMKTFVIGGKGRTPSNYSGKKEEPA